MRLLMGHCVLIIYVVRYIVASRPTVRQPNKSKTAEEFKTVADGRMVITELEEDQPQSQQKDDGTSLIACQSICYVMFHP